MTIDTDEAATPKETPVPIDVLAVNETAGAPVLTPVPDPVVDEGTEFTFTVEATNSDVPSQFLSFSLNTGAPADSSMTTDGVFFLVKC